jgi:hypothetical protein
MVGLLAESGNSLHFPFECSPLASCRPVAWGVGVVFLSVFRLLARWIYLESLVQIGYVVPGLLSHLSPGDDMIPDEGIMAPLLDRGE